MKEKHGDLDKAVCASTPSTPQCEEYARRRIMIIRFRVLVIIADRCPTIDQEPLSIDAVRRFSVDSMAWGWTDSYRPSHLHSSPSHALHDKIAGGISEGIFTADSRELNIHPITPAQAD